MLLQEGIVGLRKANDLLSRRRRTKKRRIQEGGILTIEAARDSEAQSAANIQLQADLRESRSSIKQSEPQKRYCRCCRQTSYNIRTCLNVIDTSYNSSSEELELIK
jgi:hypothetical protein